MWVRVSDESSGSPVRRTITYGNSDTGLSARVYYHTLGSGGFPVAGYYFVLGSVVFGPYTTDAETKLKADAVLQPFYIDLP
jgi:hypothetical protein